jgi:hypothetical protein
MKPKKQFIACAHPLLIAEKEDKSTTGFYADGAKQLCRV